MGIKNRNLDEITLNMSFPHAVTADSKARVRVPFTGKVISVLGTLGAGTGTTSIGLTRERQGVASTGDSVGTVNVVTASPTAMTLVAGASDVAEGDTLMMVCSAAGTAPFGAALHITMKKKHSS